MSEKLLEEILQRLDKAGELATAGGKAVWPILVKQAATVGWLQLGIGVLLLLLGGAGVVLIYKLFRDDDPYDAEIGAGLLLFLALALIGGILVAIGIPHLINPEYYALQDILGR